MRKQVAITASLLLTLSLGACSGSGGDASSADDAPTSEQPAQVAEPTNEQPTPDAEPATEQPAQDAEPANQVEQVFETDAAKVTYRDKMEATPGNAMFNFALENKTASKVLVYGDNLVVNGDASVKTLGGSVAPIQPGTTGSVSLLFGYTVQTSLQSMDEIHQFSGELVMLDDDTSDEVGRIPFSIEV